MDYDDYILNCYKRALESDEEPFAPVLPILSLGIILETEQYETANNICSIILLKIHSAN